MLTGRAARDNSLLQILFLLGDSDKLFDIFFTRRVVFLGAIERRPHRLALEQPHGMNHAISVACEAMVDTFGESQKVSFLHMNADPLVLEIAYIEVPAPTKYEADLFRIMN